MANFRGYVMVVRERAALTPGERPHIFAAERQIEKLVQDSPSKFCQCMSVFGDVDLIVPVEADTLNEIHDAIDEITTGGGVLYTKTYIASCPDFTTKSLKERYTDTADKPDQVCIGICTIAGGGVKGETQRRLIASGADVVDRVFGDFDLIALFTPKIGVRADLLKLIDGIREIETIKKTTTYLRLAHV